MPPYVTEAVFFVLRPSNLIAIALVVGLVLAVVGVRQWGLGLIALGTLAYVALGFFPIGKIALDVLEQRFPKPDLEGQTIDGIVVLGGAISPDVTAAHGETALNEASERIVATAALAQRFPAARIVVSGGPERFRDGTLVGAPAVAELLAAFGVDASRIALEPGSGNTWENATFALEVAKPQPDERWLVVTSAWHMPRAIGALRAAGWPNVTAWPVDYRSAGERIFDVTVASADGLQHANLAAREFLGLAGYKFLGRVETLLPQP